ncbi:hypothetical protein AB0E71_28360 [Streptomyces narbonensis]|uniref:hypothetical protein n=1 Tax=Streptomyces narbonensis TaxID=67333 RepID=UPI0033EB4A10
MYAITLEQVGDAIGVSQTVAGERRKAAADLIANGYTGWPEPHHTPKGGTPRRGAALRVP